MTRSIISCENIYVDIESEISLISEYAKDKKKPVVQLLLKEFCQQQIEEVYRKIEENAKETGRFIPNFSEINICDQTRDAYQKNSMQKKTIKRIIGHLVNKQLNRRGKTNNGNPTMNGTRVYSQLF